MLCMPMYAYCMYIVCYISAVYYFKIKDVYSDILTDVSEYKQKELCLTLACTKLL